MMNNPLVLFVLERILPTQLMRVTALGLMPLLGVAVFLPLEPLGVAKELIEGYPLLVRLAFVSLAAALLLLALLIELLYHHYRQQNDRSDFVEYDGAFLKKKKEGGLHECVYCGSCHESAASETNHYHQKYKCKCGWSSQFDVSKFSYDFPKLNEAHGAEPVDSDNA